MGGVGGEVLLADPMMLTADHAPEAGEVALCVIGVDPVAAVGLGVGDATHLERGLQQIPVRPFIGRDDGAGGNPLLREVDRLGLPEEGAGEGTSAPLAEDNDDASPSALYLDQFR